MASVTQTLTAWQDGETYRAAQLEGDVVAIRQTRNDEHAAEGNYSSIVAAIPLVEAVAMAKAILAQAEVGELSDAELDAFVDSLWQYEQDRLDAQSMAEEDFALEESDYDAHSWQWLPPTW